MTRLAFSAQSGVDGTGQERASKPCRKQVTVSSYARAHASNPAFEIAYYRYQRAACQAVPRDLARAGNE
jgi:hypothetical protein